MMSRGAAATPPGYVRARVGDVTVVATAAIAPAIIEIVSRGTLYGHAAMHPTRHSRSGRAPVHFIPIGGSALPIVVRHAWHGGALARITGDRFLAPTRAPYELDVALQLESIGIRTPRVVAYAIYPAGPLLRRSDLATEEIAGGVDLAAILAGESSPVSRDDALHAAGELLSSMARHGVHHPDLNLKNILVAPAWDGEPAAWLLDVDRVRVARPSARAANANAERVTRSARKWRDRFGAPISEGDLAALDGAARGRTA